MQIEHVQGPLYDIEIYIPRALFMDTENFALIDYVIGK